MKICSSCEESIKQDRNLFEYGETTLLGHLCEEGTGESSTCRIIYYEYLYNMGKRYMTGLKSNQIKES